MHILYLLFTTLLDYKPKNTTRLLENTKVIQNTSLYTLDDVNIPSIKNLSREILYEGFMAIDSIIFLVSTGIIKEKDLDTFLENTVLKAKKILLVRPGIRKYFTNFSTKVKIDDQYIKKILDLRNKVFDNDISQIAMSITRNRIIELETRVQSKLVLLEDKKDKSYIRMIKALCKSRYGEDGLAVNLSKERFEFYRENIVLSKDQILESKIALNLGGAIFSPALLTYLCKRLTIHKKRDLVKKSILAFLEPLQVLHENTINRSFMDKKKNIIEFLISCLQIRNNIYRQKIDEAFYHRSILIEHFNRENANDLDLIKILDRLQEEEIRRLIYIFENMNEDHIHRVIVHDSRVVDLYLNFICDDQDISKKKLLNLFN